METDLPCIRPSLAAATIETKVVSDTTPKRCADEPAAVDGRLSPKTSHVHLAGAPCKDHMYTVLTRRVGSHEAEIGGLGKPAVDLHEKAGNLELGHGMGDGMLDARLRQFDHDMAKRMGLLEQEMKKKGPPNAPAFAASSATTAVGVDAAQVGQALRSRGMGSLFPYLLSSVLSLRYPSLATARQAVTFLKSGTERVKSNGEVFNILTTLQKTNEQKDHMCKLMLVASCLQEVFMSDAAPMDP